MSTTAIAPATPTAFTFTGGNKFTFHDAAGTTQITFFPFAGGPLTVEPGSTGPSLTYTNSGVTKTYRSSDIRMQSSTLGIMITVDVPANDSTAAETMTLIIPAVNRLAVTGPVHFETLALMGKTIGSSEKAGAHIACSASKLRGTAENVALPL